jgi:formate-dependent nitrite reductase membrane component NrfD
MSPVLRPLLDAPWGLFIGVYFMLVGLATGITLVAYWVRPQDGPRRVRYEWLTTWMAFLTLAAASVLLVLDLGKPRRFYLMVTSFSNLDSPTSIGAKLIALKLYLLAVYLYLLARRRGVLATGDNSIAAGATRTLFAVIPAALAVVSLALAVYPAVLLARTWGSPLARTAGAGVVFLSTALLTGTAVILVMAWTARFRDEISLRAQLAHLLLFLVVAQVPLLGLWILSVHTNQAPLGAALSGLLRGAGAAVFWPVVVGLGLLLPALALPSFPARRAITICCALAVLMGASTTRYLFFSLP